VAVFARPSQDISRGSWVTNSGGTANLWATIDEAVADDADWVQSALGDNTVYEVKLSSVAPAIIARQHLISLRGRKDQAAGNQKGVTVGLYQGTTLIASQDFPTLTATVNQENISLPKSIADNITDYADLRIRFTPTGITTGGGSRRRVVITGIALRVPEATDLVDDLITRWSIVETAPSAGVVRMSHSGFSGDGANRAEAISNLYQAMKSANFNLDIVERRWDIAYYLWKSINYQAYRADVVSGAIVPAGMTQAEALAKIDAKLQRFIDIVRTADSQESD
jgi:hypothetical protein